MDVENRFSHPVYISSKVAMFSSDYTPLSNNTLERKFLKVVYKASPVVECCLKWDLNQGRWELHDIGSDDHPSRYCYSGLLPMGSRSSFHS